LAYQISFDAPQNFDRTIQRPGHNLRVGQDSPEKPWLSRCANKPQPQKANVLMEADEGDNSGKYESQKK
jgi:hypothetical protein